MMGTMQRSHRLSKEVAGRARAKVLKPEVAGRRCGEAFVRLSRAIDRLALVSWTLAHVMTANRRKVAPEIHVTADFVDGNDYVLRLDGMNPMGSDQMQRLLDAMTNTAK